MQTVNLKEAYKGSYYTIIGAGGDLQEWVNGYNEMLEERGIGQPREWFTCKGRALNKEYGLTGENRFKNNLTLLFFPLDGLNASKLAILRIKMGDHWFDDVVDNALPEDDEE